MTECTFQPAINKHKVDAGPINLEATNLYQRCAVWKDQIDKKSKKEKRQERNQQMHECSFKPDLDKSQSSFYNNRIKRTNSIVYESPVRGANTHHARILAARQQENQKTEAFLLPS